MRGKIAPMTFLLLSSLVCLLLCGCGATALSVSTGLVAADGVAVTVLHRDVFDVLVSGITGRDCSLVHLDRGQLYCRPLDPPALPPPYCIGLPECWASPQMFANPPRGLADGPWALTPDQEANRVQQFW
jgi:hypothetical protein